MSRLSEILGVKEGQEFRYSDKVFVYKVEGDFLVSLKETSKLWYTVCNDIVSMIAHPELIHPIPEKPQLTEQQITAIKGRVAEGTPWAERDIGDNTVNFYTHKPAEDFDLDDRVLSYSCSDIYDFITDENSPVYLPELIEEEAK